MRFCYCSNTLLDAADDAGPSVASTQTFTQTRTLCGEHCVGNTQLLHAQRTTHALLSRPPHTLRSNLTRHAPPPHTHTKHPPHISSLPVHLSHLFNCLHSARCDHGDPAVPHCLSRTHSQALDVVAATRKHLGHLLWARRMDMWQCVGGSDSGGDCSSDGGGGCSVMMVISEFLTDTTSKTSSSKILPLCLLSCFSCPCPPSSL